MYIESLSWSVVVNPGNQRLSISTDKRTLYPGSLEGVEGHRQQNSVSVFVCCIRFLIFVIHYQLRCPAGGLSMNADNELYLQAKEHCTRVLWRLSVVSTNYSLMCPGRCLVVTTVYEQYV